MRTEYEIENDGSKAAEDCKTEGERIPCKESFFPLEISYVIRVMTTTTLHQHVHVILYLFSKMYLRSFNGVYTPFLHRTVPRKK